jgi:hypothetical protein
VLTQIFACSTRTRTKPRAGGCGPLITPNNTINANPGNNTLVITD